VTQSSNLLQIDDFTRRDDLTRVFGTRLALIKTVKSLSTNARVGNVGLKCLFSWFFGVGVSLKIAMRTAKLILVSVFSVFGLVALTVDNPLIEKVRSLSDGPPAGRTGAPGESNCIECHESLGGLGTFEIIAPQSYLPGQTYQIQVRHLSADETRRRWGFELTALAGTSAAGTFQNLSGLTQTITESGRFYIEHTSQGTFLNQSGGAIWTFNWIAPASNLGPVRFYAAGNQANGDFTTLGDNIFLTSTESLAAGPTPTPTPTPTPIPTPTPSPVPTPTPTITPTPTPTPTTFNVTGRVLTPDGRGVRNVVVITTDSVGVRRTATTSSFGVYLFSGITPGETLTFSVASRRYRFSPRTVTVTGNLNDFDFLGQE
jgi:hypothetical protein